MTIEVKRSVCPYDCPDTCGLLVYTENDQIVKVKGDPELRTIPVIVLTTSDAEVDVLRTYSLHANAYITKPVDFARFHEVVRRIDDFFLSVVRLPNRAAL